MVPLNQGKTCVLFIHHTRRPPSAAFVKVSGCNYWGWLLSGAVRTTRPRVSTLLEIAVSGGQDDGRFVGGAFCITCLKENHFVC